VKRSISFFLALVLASFVSTSARAQEFTRRSFVTPQGSVELTGMPARPMMAGLDVSDVPDRSSLVPFHFPIHVYFGVTDRLALGPIHEIGPFYPFGGFCPNCDHIYDDLGLGILYAILRQPNFELDFNGDAPVFLQFHDRVLMSVRGGVLGRFNISPLVALVFDPSLQIGMTGRPDDAANNKDYLWLPAWFYFQVNPKVAPFVGTGIGGRLEAFSDNFAIPLEGGCIVSVTRDIDVGGVFQFYNLMGHGGSGDGRQIGFLGRFRFGGH
jgi:hypothetical protein